MFRGLNYFVLEICLLVDILGHQLVSGRKFEGEFKSVWFSGKGSYMGLYVC